MATNDPTQPAAQAPVPAQARQATLRLVSSSVIALCVLGFAAYLFSIGQGTVGGALAGMVVAHYFQAAGGQGATDSALQAVAAAGNLLQPPAK